MGLNAKSKSSKSTRKNPNYIEVLIRQWGLNESTPKVQGSARKVLGDLTSSALGRLAKARSLQVIAVPSADQGVWAYFPVYGRRRIAHQVRHMLKPTTRVLLLISEKHFEEPWRERSESHLIHSLGHAMLYLRAPKAK